MSEVRKGKQRATADGESATSGADAPAGTAAQDTGNSAAPPQSAQGAAATGQEALNLAGQAAATPATEHEGKPKMFACRKPGCSKTFTRGANRDSHEIEAQEHRQTGGIVCDRCHKNYATQKTYKNHKCSARAP